MLFDNMEGTGDGPKGHSESLFAFLNRSSNPGMERIRELLETWFAQYPSNARGDLQRRFRSDDDTTHWSAFFELYLYHLLVKIGYELQVNPDVAGLFVHPDFLVLSEGKSRFYLEATLGSVSAAGKGAKKREDVVYDTLDKMDSPNFFIACSVHGYPKSPPPGTKWRAVLEKFISSLNPEQVGRQQESGGLGALPSVTLNHDGWNVTFTAVPKPKEIRGKPGVRPLGLWSFGSIGCHEKECIRKAIKSKGTRYGNLGLPYLIAINVVGAYRLSKVEVDSALFGDEAFRFYIHPKMGVKTEATRSCNGAFIGRNGAINTRVSGVIICDNLLWGNISTNNPVLWHNPYASFPFDPAQWPLPQMKPNREKNVMEFDSGKNARGIFGLSDVWPEEDNSHDASIA
jgi:hypothetical protein